MTKKGHQLFGREKCTPRENSGYTYARVHIGQLMNVRRAVPRGLLHLTLSQLTIDIHRMSYELLFDLCHMEEECAITRCDSMKEGRQARSLCNSRAIRHLAMKMDPRSNAAKPTVCRNGI